MSLGFRRHEDTGIRGLPCITSWISVCHAKRSNGEDARAAFIRSTYAHLAGAILAFIVLEAFLLTQVFTSLDDVIKVMGGRSAFGPLMVMLLFMGATMLAQMWARSETSVGLQYLGLALCVVAYAVIFVPILWIATNAPAFANQNLIPTAGILTLSMFGGLTASVFITKKDHSGLAPILSVGSMIALGGHNHRRLRLRLQPRPVLHLREGGPDVRLHSL